MIAPMCLIVFALNPDPRRRLVLVANRDEFHHRPARAMHWWTDDGPLAGLDEQSGGTWLAIMPDGRIAAVTNFRSGKPENGRRSRGGLPMTLLDADTMAEGVAAIRSRSNDYGRFNLIGFDGQRVHFVSSEAAGSRTIESGIHGVSNHVLDTPWPKLRSGCQWLADVLRSDENEESIHDYLIRQFAHTTPAPDSELPDTGIGTEMERALSPVFIPGRHYGTRATTVVSITHDGVAGISEQSYGPDGIEGSRQRFRFDTLGYASRVVSHNASRRVHP